VDPKIGDVIAAPARKPIPRSHMTQPKGMPQEWERIITRAGATPILGLLHLRCGSQATAQQGDREGCLPEAMVTHHPDKGGHEECAKAVIAGLKFLEPLLT